ncbi:hypothetical protein CJF30_00011024 [Rutstroemia sp. NJR-2017a BBW]|nr:hypothetical protein CJF30_00011024 [Rutstroemia sp. NJR-2017a BBW]
MDTICKPSQTLPWVQLTLEAMISVTNILIFFHLIHGGLALQLLLLYASPTLPSG